MPNQSLLKESTEVIASNYKVGDIDSAGAKVTGVISRSKDCIVYFVEGNLIRYEIRNLKWNISNVVMHFDELRNKVSDDLPESVLKRTMASLGLALFHSTRAECEEDALKGFLHVEKRIKNLRTPNEAKAKLIAFNLIFSIILSLSLIFLLKLMPNLSSSLFACIASGGYGALFSLLQRNSTIPLNLTADSSYILLQSLFICILGAISGSAVFLLANSELALSVAKDNVSMLALFSMISGFSERMIPDLFNKVQKENE